MTNLRQELIETASNHLKKIWLPSDGPKLSQTIAGLVLDAILPALAKEFRRLAAEARSGASRTQSDYRRAVNSSRAQTFEQAAQMLEEKLNG
jgi:hypothetical protein